MTAYSGLWQEQLESIIINSFTSFLNQSVRFDNLEKMIEMVESSLVESNRRQNMKLFLMFNFP